MKQTTAAFALFSVLIITMGCNNRPAKQKTITRDTTSHNQSRPTAADTAKGDSIAVAQIEKLPEYKRITAWFDTASKDSTHHIAILVEAEPTKQTNYYQLELGEDGPERFANMELFYVDAQTYAVKHVDNETDSASTIEQWRKSGKDDWWKGK